MNTHSNLSSRSQNLTSVVKVNLPKIQLPNYEGNVQQWTEFWDMFKTCVDEQNISKACKFNYLKSVLKGAVAAAISGISICDDNYDDAVALLKERFGREEVIIESLYAKLQSLPKSCSKFTEVRQTYQSIEKVLRQLEAQGEAINNQRILIQLVLSKFPSEIIVKLEESKQPTKGWNKEDKEELSDSNVEDLSTPIKRAAAVEARNRISRLLRDDDQITGVFFCVSPGSVMN